MDDSQIHPTAIIDPGAEIGTGCVIGAYCVVGRLVKLGAGCTLHHHVSVTGPSCIGARNRFHPFACIGQQSQDLKYTEEPTCLEIGDDNVFREFCTVHRGTAPQSCTRIGHGGNFLAYTHIAHDCVIGNHVIFSNNGTVAGHVEVGDFAIIGGLTAIHQFCRIGQHAITGGCSKIVQDVPPFMIADGNPARVRGVNKVGLERHGFDENRLRTLKEAYRILYRSSLNLQEAVEKMSLTLDPSADLAVLTAFATSSARGIIR